MNADTGQVYTEPEQIAAAEERREPLFIVAEPTLREPVKVLKTPDGTDVQVFTNLLLHEVRRLARRRSIALHQVLKVAQLRKIALQRALRALRKTDRFIDQAIGPDRKFRPSGSDRPPAGQKEPV